MFDLSMRKQAMVLRYQKKTNKKDHNMIVKGTLFDIYTCHTKKYKRRGKRERA